MSNWYYFNENGEKIGPVSATTLKDLARQGLVTKETKIVNSNGRSAVAGQVNGLVFSETKRPEQSQSFELAGFDFPALTSEGSTPDGFDPFARAATHQTPMPSAPSKPLSPLAKPIVLVPISVGCGMLLMFLMMLPFTTTFGSKREESQESRRIETQENRQSKLQEVRQVKTENNAKTSRIVLKEPHEKEAFVKRFNEETIAAMKKSLGDEYASVYDSAYQSVFSASWDAAKTVYDMANSTKEEKDLLKMMTTLKNCYDICIANTATQWSGTLRSRYIGFHFSIVVNQVSSTYESNNCYYNLDQIKTAIKESVKKLDKRKYENTIKLFAVLSQYEKAATEPSGSYQSYMDNRNACREEFTRTMSLAELEW